MFKKLIAVFMALAMAACSAIPVYADLNQITTESQSVQPAAETTSTGEIGSTGGQEQASNGTDSEGTKTEEPAWQPAVDPEEGQQVEQPSEQPTEDQNQDKEDQDTQDQEKDKQDKKTTKKISKYQKGLAAYIRSKNRKLSKNWSITLAGYFIKYGDKYDVDPKVLMGLALRESNFRAKAKSRYGYKGIMQCGDAFARSNGYKPSDLYKADVSIKIAAKYIKAMKKKHKTYSKAICCYVCGSGAVAKGIHSREPGRSVMKTRNSIKTFLKEKGYV